MRLNFKSGWSFKRLIKSGAFNYLLAIVIIGGAGLFCTPLANTQNYHLVSFILLFIVSLLSTFMGVGPVLLASTLAALIWNFFFIPPHYTFNIEKTEDLLIFGLFFIIALVNGVLTTRVRRQEQISREREKKTNALFQLTRELSKASGLLDVQRVAVEEIRHHFNIISFFFLQDGNNTLNSFDNLNKDVVLKPEDYDLAEWVFKNSRMAGPDTDKPHGTNFTFFPLPGTRINPGVVAIRSDNYPLDEQKNYWETFLAQISNALEREFLGELAQKVRFLDESDRLYKTLFNSISHELRIPVATIMGASDSILNASSYDNSQSALCQEIFTASVRLNRLIENLLNISRLESGHISVRLDWYDINDLINKVTNDLKDELKSFNLIINIKEEMPLVKIDFGLMEQVLYNLLFNSTQYTSEGSEIELKVGYADEQMIIEISDRGPGFPDKEIKNVFVKFFRVNGSKPGGLGLGLSIVKGFVEAHNGSIKAENLKDKGARFTIKIPTIAPEIAYV